MSEAKKDTVRATAAAKAILDGRSPTDDWSTVLVTTEHAIATLLLVLFPDPRKAAEMLNEGLLPGIEARLNLHASRQNT